MGQRELDRLLGQELGAAPRTNRTAAADVRRIIPYEFFLKALRQTSMIPPRSRSTMKPRAVSPRRSLRRSRLRSCAAPRPRPARHPSRCRCPDALAMLGTVQRRSRAAPPSPEIVLLKDRHAVGAGIFYVDEELRAFQRDQHAVVSHLVARGFTLLGCEHTLGPIPRNAAARGPSRGDRARRGVGRRPQSLVGLPAAPLRGRVPRTGSPSSASRIPRSTRRTSTRSTRSRRSAQARRFSEAGGPRPERPRRPRRLRLLQKIRSNVDRARRGRGAEPPRAHEGARHRRRRS